MNLVMPALNREDPGTVRALELFREQQDVIYRQTDRMFVTVMGVQWLGAIIISLLVSPSVWHAQSSWNFTVAALCGSLFCGIPIWLAAKNPGATSTRHAVAVGQMLTSALLIHLTGGRIESHFHIFGSLAFLALYRDWKILLSATTIISLDLAVLGIMHPLSVFGEINVSVWRQLEHIGWILFEDAFLILATRASLRSMFDMAKHQVQLQTINETIERKVAERTSQLKEENAERKRMQTALRKSEEKFRSLSESSPVGIFQVDLMGRCVYTNAKWQSLMNMTFAESLGDGLMRPIHPEDRDKVQVERDRCVKGDGEYSQEFRILDANKAVRWIYGRARAIRSESGEASGYVGTAEDITERKHVEEELRKAHAAAQSAAQTKSEFLANMSHEIRTPMNGVLGMTNLLLDTELTTQQTEFAQTIHASAESLLALVNDILDFSKIEAKKLSFEILDFDLQETVEGALELVAESAQAKGLELVNFVMPDIPKALRGDPGRLRQVVTNLASNAIKFTDKGEVVVDAQLVSETPTHVTLKFEIRDTGIGISKEVQAHLFQAFQQADGSTTRKYGGTGLGLVISKQLVELMNGQIGVESEHGKGSVFWFTVVFEKQPAKTDMVIQARDLSSIRLLIVEKNDTSRSVLARLAKAWQIQAVESPSSSQALEILRAKNPKPFDVALIDVDLAGVDGVGLARAIKGDSAIKDTRIIFTSPLGKRLKDDQIKAAQGEACLAKPIKQTRLFQALSGIAPPSHKVDAVTNAALDLADRKLRILLAEDNVINQKVALGQLRKMGCAADVVANGLEAVDAVKRIPYDIVLMDCQMPEMDGYEATRQIRLLERSLGRHIHIIAMTAHAMQGDREKCLGAGMDDYITKPMREQEFKRALGRCRPSGAAGSANKPAIRREKPASTKKNIVDMETLASAANEDPEQLQELVELYLAQAKDLMNGLQTALKSGSCKQVDHFANKLVGASLACGMSAMIFPLRELERRGKEGRLEDAQQFFDQASSYLQMTSESLNEYLKENEKAPTTK
jgi:PAS domain S-box-containing protein